MRNLNKAFFGAIIVSVIAVTVPAFAQLAKTPIKSNAPSTTDVVPPAGAQRAAVPGAVILRDGSHSQTMQGLKVERQFTLPALRAQPVMQLGRAQLNLAPVLNNPAALHNVAQRLRGQPQLVRVVADDTRGYQVRQGLVIASSITYAVKPGGCSTAARRATLQQAGVGCFTRMSPSQVKAANAGRTGTDAARGGIKTDIGQLKGLLATPAGRTQIEAEVGPAEAARLGTLSDDQLEEEMVNGQTTKIDQLMFVPSADLLDNPQSRPGAKTGPLFLDVTPAEKVSVSRELTPRIFLTGFTLGRKFEWSKRVETTIKWCLVGCKKTYYASAYASFEYAFGLRFPVRMEGTYDYHRKGTTETATIAPRFTPINGSAEDYASTGLPSDQIHDGQELVAEVKATVGAEFNVPFYPVLGGSLTLGKNLAAELPAPFAGGQFTPPAPGTATAEAPFVFEDIDLIGGRADLGVVYAKVFPAVKIGVHSDALTFNLHDNATNKDIGLTGQGQKVELGIAADHESNFSISSPLYTLGFDLTPGLDARLGVNIAVWSNHWDVMVWFPQMKITLPPGGFKFSCHAETVCAQNYRISPGAQSQSDGASSPELALIDNLGNSFELYWAPKCADKQCKTGIKFLRAGATGKAKTSLETGKFVTHGFEADAKYFFYKAGLEAPGIIDESLRRKARKDADGWVLLTAGVWTPRCSDDLCRSRIKQLSTDLGNTLVERRMAQPDVSATKITGQVGAEYQPKFQQEIDESTARARTRAEPIRALPANNGAAPVERKP